MTFFQKLIKLGKDRKGVALLIVLASMATLSVFVGEITYTAQINQKLAYDRLDQVKAQALAKSGLKLALLRIRAYSEIKKTVSSMAKTAGVSDAQANSVMPRSVIEKIWSEPITIPFTGDISGLPGGIKDALGKFRKDSHMEGRVYISIQAQSSKMNLNSVLSAFASQAGSGNATPSPSPGTSTTTTTSTTGTGTTAAPSATPAGYDAEQARKLLSEQFKASFQQKMDDDDKFRDAYRSYRIDDLVEDVLGWCDLSYQSPRESSAKIKYKQAPFYNISELNYLDSMDDDVYNLLSEQFTAGVASALNVNTIKEPVLRALLPGMTTEEVKLFFDFRDSTGDQAGKTTSSQQASGDDNSFKSADDFFKYLKDKVAIFGGSDSKISDFKNSLSQRGITITVDESNFLVHIEATVQQTKRILEAMVSITSNSTGTTGATGTNTTGQPTPTATPAVTQAPGSAAAANDTTQVDRSNLKITQLRFL